MRYKKRYKRRRTSLATSKKQILLDDSVPANLDTRALYIQRLDDITRSSNPEINERIGAQIKLCGAKVRWCIRNQVQYPICFNWAIIIPKGVADQTASTQTSIAKRFFRDYGTIRGGDFNTTRRNLVYLYREINKDKFIILKHKRHWLGPRPTVQHDLNLGVNAHTITTGTRPGTDTVNAHTIVTQGTNESSKTYSDSKSNWLVKEQYIKLNRRATYWDSSGDTTTSPPYLVYWFERLEGIVQTTSAVGVTREFIAVFRDAGNS